MDRGGSRFVTFLVDNYAARQSAQLDRRHGVAVCVAGPGADFHLDIVVTLSTSANIPVSLNESMLALGVLLSRMAKRPPVNAAHSTQLPPPLLKLELRQMIAA
jgi:hypothetical protein